MFQALKIKFSEVNGAYLCYFSLIPIQGVIRFLLVSSLICEALTAQNIQTIAGNGLNNLQALQIGLANPSGIAVDASGNVYVSVEAIYQIWKIDSSGRTSRYAGNGNNTFNGDGIQAVTAAINPRALTLDSEENPYVAEYYNNRVRKISPAGIITTVAGNGRPGFGGDGGSATAAQIDSPAGLAVDASNNINIADSANNRIRIVSPAGTITTVAGVGTSGFSGDGAPALAAQFSFPSGIAIDSLGAVYIADGTNYRLRKFQPGGNISTIAGNGTQGYSGDGGLAISAQLNAFKAVAVDQFRNIYIVEDHDIRMIAANEHRDFCWHLDFRLFRGWWQSHNRALLESLCAGVRYVRHSDISG